MHCFLTQECNQIQNIKGINMNENVILSVKNLKTFFFNEACALLILGLLIFTTINIPYYYFYFDIKIDCIVAKNTEL